MNAADRAVPARRAERRRLLSAGRLVLGAVLLALVAGAAPAQAGISARNTPQGRCVVTASLPDVGPWDLRLQVRRGGRWVGFAKAVTWTGSQAEFACAAERRARIRVRAVSSSGTTVHTSTIRQPAPVVPQVRVVYARPRDRASRTEFGAAVRTTAAAVQGWYREQLGGRTFRLSSRGVERCVLRRSAAYYARRTYDRVLTDLERCVPISIASPGYTWLVYVDVDHACGERRVPLGVGVRGLAILPRSDLDGIAGYTARNDCGQVQDAPQGRWVGGAAHELGHAFGLAHPPGCDRGRPSCDAGSVMWLGYWDFPDAYLTAGERSVLRRSPYFGAR